jgi:ABC-type multidrug transport system ATPase subunit
MTLHPPETQVGTVSLAGVVALVDRFPVLTGVDLELLRGQTVLVSGANGAGKTSLLRVLAGDLAIASGRAVVLERDVVRERRAHRQQVALVGASAAGYDDLPVARNLQLFATASGVTPDVVARTMHALGLDELADVPHGRLSTGQRRRCALAVALVRNVALLLLDEPHSGLDAGARRIVDDAIGAAQARGATVLVVSHEVDLVRRLADREVVMAGGRVV